jgi:hypothetical protein
MKTVDLLKKIKERHYDKFVCRKHVITTLYEGLNLWVDKESTFKRAEYVV